MCTVFHLKVIAIVIEMDKYRLEVPCLTPNKHGNLLYMTSLALDVHRAHFESLAH